MHIKNMHCMIEDLTEYGKCMIEAGVGNGNVNLCDAGQIVDMIKDLADAEYHSLISKEMKEYKEEKEAEEKYMMRMLKEDHKDEYKKMREEYGEEDGERRFYDSYRYKTTGRFAPKGRGSYMPRSSGRRGYEEPPYYHMTPEMMREHDPEYWRDMDRTEGKMYYTSMSGGNMGESGNTSGGSSTRGYEEYQRGYSEGRTEGYNQGRSDGRNSQSRDYREGRSGTSRRGYMESRENHKDNTPESKQANMRELEKYMKSLSEDLTEAIEGASNEEKTMLKSKLQTLVQKIQ